jgi:3-deoxy-D-manno-octulosonate 8-phosphate phosphatase (KDO 8-P phosphatase)
MPDPDPRHVRLLCLDVDGVLTDGTINLDDHGVERKRFHVRDGTAVRLWLRLGFEVAIITGRSSMAVRHRANELGIVHVIQKSSDKGASLAALLRSLDLEPLEVAVLGDDLPDLPAMRLAGYPMAVADAVPEIRGLAAFVTTHPGGRGAVREAVEHLLKAMDLWDDALAHYG